MSSILYLPVLQWQDNHMFSTSRRNKCETVSVPAMDDLQDSMPLASAVADDAVIASLGKQMHEPDKENMR
jgi:hypothetical protein